jgi:hypothetical protein
MNGGVTGAGLARVGCHLGSLGLAVMLAVLLRPPPRTHAVHMRQPNCK